ncbi:hypothetical protein EIP91_004302 [Steccherinum ochraceum]|uniref:DUF6533 domain-containing protein n=1 Tax=Steccherinum ochraceum TaxID=92696 RepID=A0A4R0RC37_9APHY|nr:hypothetical protein EIP91_004302 [Steccherinum ochraceum]
MSGIMAHERYNLLDTSRTDLNDTGTTPSLLNLNVVPLTTVALTALLVYDYILTFDSEVNLIWSSNWSTVKVLFVLTRYLPFSDMFLVLYYQTKTGIDSETCKRMYFPTVWLIIIGIVVAELVLVVRTWALWGRSRNIAICLGIACVVALLPVFVVESVFLKTLRFSQYSDPRIPGCLLTGGSSIAAVNFIVVILFETFLLVLTLIVGVQRYRRLRGGSGLVAVLYRDGVLFYVYLLRQSASYSSSAQLLLTPQIVTSIANLVLNIVAPRELAGILASFQRILHSLLAARVLFNLREAAMREVRPLSALNSGSVHFRTQHSQDIELDCERNGEVVGDLESRVETYDEEILPEET